MEEGKTVEIRRVALEFALEASRRTYPDEFIGLLRKNEKGTITEILVIPLSTFGRDFSSIDFTMLPALSSTCGSIHSHPDGVPLPSGADLNFFSRTGDAHFITASPFTLASTRAFDSKGRRLSFRVVP